MPAPHRALRHVRKLEKQAPRLKLALRNPTPRTAIPQHLSRSPRRPARPLPSCRRKEIFRRAFPFRPRASNPACPVARQTEFPTRLEIQEDNRGAAATVRAMEMEKVRWT